MVGNICYLTGSFSFYQTIRNLHAHAWCPEPEKVNNYLEKDKFSTDEFIYKDEYKKTCKHIY
jgi:hypothetical protein